MRRWRPTLICTHIDILARLIRWPGIERGDFASLRAVFTGGDKVPPTLQRQFIDKTGLPIQIGWGMTEAIWLTLCREPRFEAAECIGVPVGGAELRVTDPDGQDLPTDAVGELRVRGPMVMQGYWRDPDASSASLEAGWLRTGDSGWRDADGLWWFATRLKELIVRNTSKISPGEVETALNEHPAVLASGVVGMADPNEGEVPVAYVVQDPERSTSEAELLTFLKGRIAQYKMPVRIEFLQSLPLTLSGKLDHRALREAANATLVPHQ
jgi:long-chain acyl-CoA synthetase